MAHFAQINKNNVVTQVVVISNDEILDDAGQESEAKGVAFCQKLLGGNWVQTSYSKKFRKNFAGVGFKYDENFDVFIFPKPYESWILDTDTFQWGSPVPYPQDDKQYYWDESIINWVEVINEQTT